MVALVQIEAAVDRHAVEAVLGIVKAEVEAAHDTAKVGAGAEAEAAVDQHAAVVALPEVEVVPDRAAVVPFQIEAAVARVVAEVDHVRPEAEVGHVCIFY